MSEIGLAHHTLPKRVGLREMRGVRDLAPRSPFMLHSCQMGLSGHLQKTATPTGPSQTPPPSPLPTSSDCHVLRTRHAPELPPATRTGRLKRDPRPRRHAFPPSRPFDTHRDRHHAVSSHISSRLTPAGTTPAGEVCPLFLCRDTADVTSAGHLTAARGHLTGGVCASQY